MLWYGLTCLVVTAAFVVQKRLDRMRWLAEIRERRRAGQRWRGLAHANRGWRTK
jgi:hypothetical protein